MMSQAGKLECFRQPLHETTRGAPTLMVFEGIVSFPHPHLNTTECVTNHITQVYVLKSKSRKVIYVHERYRPFFVCFTTISFTLHVQMLQVSVARVLWPWWWSHKQRCSIGNNFEAHGREHTHNWWILASSQYYVDPSCPPSTENVIFRRQKECDFLSRNNGMFNQLSFMTHCDATRAIKPIQFYEMF